MVEEEATTTTTDADETEGKKGGRSASKWIIWSVVIVVQIVVAFLLVKMFLYPMYVDWAANRAVAEEVEEETVQKEMGSIYKISNLTVNPRGTDGRRFAIFEVALETTDPKTLGELQTFEPLIKDRFIAYFRSKTVASLSDVASMDSTKQNLLSIVNGILNKDTVDNIYFTQFVLQ